jgi:hypothetical protein
VQDTNLTNPHIIDQVKSITDVSGRRIDLFYTDKGLMAELVDGAGTADPGGKFAPRRAVCRRGSAARRHSGTSPVKSCQVTALRGPQRRENL